MPTFISIKPEGFAEAAKALSGMTNGFPKAATEAINKGLEKGKTAASRLVRGRYNMSAGGAKGQLEIKRASWMAIGGTLEAKGPMMPVSLFSPRISKRGTTKGGVMVTIIRGNAKLVKGAFMPGSRVMERRQPSRYPIFPVSTIGIPFMVGYMGIAKQVEEIIAKTTMERLAHNVALFLGKGKASFR